MPKQKSNRGAAKRFKITASGKVKHKRAFARHILTSKDRARKRRLRKPGYVAAADERRVKRLLNLA